MKLMHALILPLVALAQTQTGTIEVLVVDSASKMPVKKAQVVLSGGPAPMMGGSAPMMSGTASRIGGPAPPGMIMSGRNTIPMGRLGQQSVPSTGGMIGSQAPPQPTVTDASGSASFANLAAGSYEVMVNHPKYPMMRTGGARKRVDTSTGGGGSARVTIELIPGAVVTGRVLDEDGDPVSGCMIQTMQAGAEANAFMRGGGAFSTQPSDSNGEYRTSGVEAGKYLIVAHCRRPVFQPRPLSSGPAGPPSFAYPPQYYPLASEPQGAEIIDIAPGIERSGVDFRLKPARVFSISGVLTSAAGDFRDRNDLMLTLVSRKGSRGMGANMFGGPGTKFDRQTGAFEFQSVLPGSYYLLAATHSDPTKRLGLLYPVEVADRPVRINPELRAATDLTGVIEIEGEQKGPRQRPNLQLMEAEMMGLPGPVVEVREDGTFVAKGLLPAVWKVQVWAQGAYVKSVSSGGQDSPDRVIDTTAGVPASVRILLSTKTGSIRGKGTPGQWVQIIGGNTDPRFGQGRTSMIDPQGQFTAPDLAPGKYKVLTGMTPTALALESAQEVTVSEGETATIELKPER